MNSVSLVKALGELHAVDSTEHLLGWTLDDFAPRFGCDFLVWTRYDSKGQLIGANLGKDVSTEVWQYGPIIQQNLASHPAAAMVQETSPKAIAAKTTDFLSQRQVDKLPLFHDAYRHMGARHQLVVALHSPLFGSYSLTCGRNGRDYSSRQVETMRAVALHLNHALERLARIEMLEAQIADRGSLIFSIIECNRRWHYSSITEEAIRQVRQHFGPAKERFWLSPKVAMALPAAIAAGGEAVLSALDQTGWKLSVREMNSGELGVSLKSLGPVLPPKPGWMKLTRREQEVALALRSGQSNAEIARELSISPRTVEKHLDHIFSKLGVSNRGAAIHWINS